MSAGWPLENLFLSDIPINVAKGAVTTADFEVNLSGRYWFRLEDAYYSYWYGTRGCAANDLQHGVQTRWTFSGPHGVIIDEVSNYFQWKGLVDVNEKGHYFVRVQIPSDPVCLGNVHPRLRAERLGDEYGEYRVWIGLICLVFVAAGIGLVILVRSTTSIETLEKTFWPSRRLGARYFAGARFGRAPRVSGLPSYGIVASLVLFAVVLAMYVGQVPIPSKGIYVRLVRPNAPKADPWPEPLIIRFESKWTGKDNVYRWFVNERKISQENLSSELRKKLALRAKWIVYVEADSNSAYGVALDAIDVVRGLHATPVLLTPQTLRELEQSHPLPKK